MKRDEKPSPLGCGAVTAFHHAPRIRLSEQQIAKLFMARNGCCRECGRKLYPGDQWIVEHIIALENGGTNDWENLGITCGWCKPQKDARDHAQAGKQRRVATRHVVPESLREKSALAPRPGWKFNWKTKRYERIASDE